MVARDTGTSLAVCLVLLAGFDRPADAADTSIAPANGHPTSIADFTKDMVRAAGFLTLYRNERDGALYIEIPASGTPDLLYQATLASGFGRRDVSLDGMILDRGFLAPSRLVAFRRFDGKALLIERNTSYFTPAAALGSTLDSGFSFPGSVVANFDIKVDEGARLLLDATNFFRHDGIGIVGALKSAAQGQYTLDDKLSAIDSASVRASDQSLDVEALLTFTTSDAKPEKDLLSEVVANRNAILLREHHALFKLPDLGASPYRSRIFDPRVGYFDLTFYDPSRPPHQSLRRSYIMRHPLTRKDPVGPLGEPEHPIIFFIDPSVPLELHPLIAEAVSWWNPAFEAAGFRNALEVRELPRDLDPLSIGVNVIMWVPRSTRGWSYGTAVSDPRTGEILKATVRLDGMRLRADRLLFDALTAPYSDHPDLVARDEALRQRFRALVAHEVGHALGLRHQYIGSAQGNSSVMDYPFPSIAIDADGKPFLREVFPSGVGTWDKLTIQYGYRTFPAGEEAVGLHNVIEEVERSGLYWMTDEDSNDADPLVQKWDIGTDPIAELEKILALRRTVLQRFSTAVIPADEPLAVLQDALVPVYLLHQFAVKPVAAMLGGFRYSMRCATRLIPYRFLPTSNVERSAHCFQLSIPRR